MNTHSTRGCSNSAEVCRKNGWIAGTKLVGNEGYGDTVIVITAIGEEGILARELTFKGEPARFDREGSWTLSCREWREDSE